MAKGCYLADEFRLMTIIYLLSKIQLSAVASDITLYPYGLVCRHGTPATTGMYILHEGPLGVFDETLKEEDYGDLRDAGATGIKVTPETAGGWVGITTNIGLPHYCRHRPKAIILVFRPWQGKAIVIKLTLLTQMECFNQRWNNHQRAPFICWG